MNKANMLFDKINSNSVLDKTASTTEMCSECGAKHEKSEKHSKEMKKCAKCKSKMTKKAELLFEKIAISKVLMEAAIASRAAKVEKMTPGIAKNVSQELTNAQATNMRDMYSMSTRTPADIKNAQDARKLYNTLNPRNTKAAPGKGPAKTGDTTDKAENMFSNFIKEKPLHAAGIAGAAGLTAGYVAG